MKIQLLVLAILLMPLFSIAQTVPTGLQVNDKSPDFTATDQQGQKFNLFNELKKGPVVLVFYRGQWCPYCNKQLKQLEDSLIFIKDKSASLVAIAPETPKNILKTVGKTKATYPVLYDEGLKIMKRYDVAFAVDDKTVSR